MLYYCAKSLIKSIFSELAIVTDISLNWNVNFDAKILSGYVTLSVDRVKDTNEVVSNYILFTSQFFMCHLYHQLALSHKL